MQPWMGIVAVLVVGIGLVVYGAIWDRTTNKLRHHQLRSAPDRTVPGLSADAPTPDYLQAADLLKQRPELVTDPDALAALRVRTDAAPSLPHGHLDPAFATHAGGLCVLDDPVIVVIASELGTVRELLPVAEHAKRAARPLVVVAPGVAPDVLQTLVVNTLAGTLRADAVAIADPDHLRQLASLVGALPVATSDLRAGWVPETSLGTCGTWVSSSDRLWVLAAPDQA